MAVLGRAPPGRVRRGVPGPRGCDVTSWWAFVAGVAVTGFCWAVFSAAAVVLLVRALRDLDNEKEGAQ